MKAAPFEVMVTGEKKEEYREKSQWMTSRLVDTKTGKAKHFDRVKFVNGYGADKPSFTVSFKGYRLEENGVHAQFSNGLTVDLRGKPTYVISLGDDIVK